MKICNAIYAIIGMFVLLSCQKQGDSSTPSLQNGTITDVEGNIYKTVKIGTQTWMAENLKTTKYSDGGTIPLSQGSNISTPAYCWYNNDAAKYKNKYGALYNWFAVNSGKLCPSGWHVPTAAEWTTLVTFVGGENVAGGKLKENIPYSWTSSSVTSTNEYGFSALPGGSFFGGDFMYELSYGFWWSSTAIDSQSSSLFEMLYDKSQLQMRSSDLAVEMSVRCMKN